MDARNTQLASQSGLASWSSAWLAVGSAGYRMLSSTIAWSAVAATAGVITFEGSDDPAHAAPVTLTIDKTHGDDISAVGASAGEAVVVLADCPGWVRIVYTRSAGGGAGQFTMFATLTE